MNLRMPARIALAVASLAGAACTGVATSIGGKPGPDEGLLRGKMPVRSSHVSHLDRLTDGIAAFLDDPPRTELAALFASPDAFVVYDLGAETRVACASVDADGNDQYVVALSSDGVTFTPLWTAPAVPDAGVQPRAIHDLHGRGRYLRLSAAGGDGVYAVAEVSAAAECPPRWPPLLAPQHGTPIDHAAATKAWAFAALAAAYVLGYRRKLPDFIKLLIAAPLGVGIALVLQVVDIWPPPPSLRLPLLAAPAIVGAAFGLRKVLARLGPGARSAKT